LSPAFLPKKKLLEKFGKEKIKNLYQAIYYHHNYEDNTTTKDKQNIIEQDLEFYLKISILTYR
jgi:CRISPR-associated endonuclease/helicase Cas3